jgi:polar amino acid transport system substrate-binding protein
MRIIFQIITLFCIIITVFTNSASASDSDKREKLVIASGNWCPYACNPKDPNPGYLIELVTEAFDIYEIDVEYKMMPWHTALDLLSEDKIDAVVGIGEAEGRGFVLTNVPQAYGYVSAFTQSDSEWVYDGIESLNGKKMSLILDYNVEDSIKQFIAANFPKNPNLFIVETGENAVIEAIKSLIDKSTEIYVEDETVVNYYLDQHNIKTIRNAGRISPTALPIFVAFSTTSPKAEYFKKMLEEGSRSLTATGDVRELRKKYKISE